MDTAGRNPVEYKPGMHLDLTQALDEHLLLIRVTLLPLLGSDDFAVSLRELLNVDETRANQVMMDVRTELQRRAVVRAPRIVLATGPGGNLH